MPTPDILTAPQWVAALVVALAAIAIGLRKITKDWMRDGMDMARVGAETDVVGLLRTELTRVMVQNRELEAQVVSLHGVALELRAQLGAFQAAVLQLDLEVAKLQSKLTP